MAALALASSGTLAPLKTDLPMADRVRLLSPYFTPPPGNEIMIADTERLNHQHRVPHGQLRGSIEVRPPKGVCFTIRRRLAVEDTVVCKPTTLAFTLNDLSRTGTVAWTVSTGDGDFGSDLTWRTPYRLAIGTASSGVDSDVPRYFFIADCRRAPTELDPRRLRITLVSGETWTISFPSKDELLPQPDPAPNLGSGLNVPSPQAALKPKAAAPAPEGGHGEAKAEGHGEAKAEGHGDGHSTGHGEAKDEKPAKKPDIDDFEDRIVWAVGRRDAFHLKSDAVRFGLPRPPGSRGECRYTFSGPADDPQTGRLECHDTDGYKAILIPLTCLRELAPR